MFLSPGEKQSSLERLKLCPRNKGVSKETKRFEAAKGPDSKKCDRHRKSATFFDSLHGKMPLYDTATNSNR